MMKLTKRLDFHWLLLLIHCLGHNSYQYLNNYSKGKKIYNRINTKLICYYNDPIFHSDMQI